METNASEADLMATATVFYFALYSQKKSNTINSARYDIFRKRKNPLPLKSLPPTEVDGCNKLQLLRSRESMQQKMQQMVYRVPATVYVKAVVIVLIP